MSLVSHSQLPSSLLTTTALLHRPFASPVETPIQIPPATLSGFEARSGDAIDAFTLIFLRNINKVLIRNATAQLAGLKVWIPFRQVSAFKAIKDGLYFINLCSCISKVLIHSSYRCAPLSPNCFEG
jgi:hypothetical protein